jgi:hypothetical protein
VLWKRRTSVPPGSRTTRNVWSAAFLQAKNEDDGMVCANVFGLFVSSGSWHLMECAALASYLISKSRTTYSGLQVSRAPGSTVLPSHCSPANLAGNPNSCSSRRGGLRLWESRKRFPRLASFARRQLQASSSAPTTSAASNGGRYASPFARTAHAMRATCWLGQLPRHCYEPET